MNRAILICIIIVLAYVVQTCLPWWCMAIVCFSVCYKYETKLFSAFAVSLLAIFCLWYVKAMISDKNFDVPMSTTIGAILGNISGSSIYFLTAIVGGIVGGLSGLIGSWTKSLTINK